MDSLANSIEALAASRPATFWGSVREAIRGSHRDYTAVSLNRAIFLLAIPMVLEMAMESLFAVADVFWVAHLGEEAVATVGLTESVLTLVVAVAFGLGLSTTAMVARRIGEKDPEDAAVAAGQSVILGIFVSVVMGLPCWWLAPRLLHAMGATPGIVAVGSGYTRIVLGASGVIVLLFLNNAIFRGAGDAAVAMRVLWLANLVNLVLDPCLIFGWGPFPRLGVTGAAVATTVGRGIGVLYQFYLLLRGTERLRVLPRQLRLDLAVMVKLVRVAASGIVQFAIAQTSWLVLVRIVSLFGAAALAGYTIGVRIIIFVILPSWGLSNAAATLVGQNLGARRPDRAEQAVWRTGVYNSLLLGSVGVLMAFLAGPLVRLFTNDPAVVPLAASCLRILCYGNVGYAFGMVMLQAFNGAGDTRTPSVVNFFGYWIFEIPLAYALAVHARLGANGVYLAILIAEAAIAAASALLFRRGKWKEQRI